MAKKKQTTRVTRLANARKWICEYNGQNIVKGYKKHYGVDIMCVIEELKILGYEISANYIEAVQQTLKYQSKMKKQRELEMQFQRYPDSDDTFFFIAGYTSGGVPYGVTWEEMGLEPYGDFENIDE